MASDTTPLGRVQVELVGIAMDEALNQAAKRLGVVRKGGASGRGWSRYRLLQKCPRAYYLRYFAPKETDAQPMRHSPLELGSCWHEFSAYYYSNMMAIGMGLHEGPAPSALHAALLETDADPIIVAEAWRLFEAYADHYEGYGDYLIPLAVEELALDKATKHSCRYDLIARVDADHPMAKGMEPGVYVVEHKTASHINTEQWHLDGEVIGQIMLWKAAKLDEKFGPLVGVIVNICTKGKVPSFHREIVTPPWEQMAAQTQHLRAWDRIERIYQIEQWPRSLAACYGDKFGPCEYVEECRE